jgi:transcription antitermination factor NusG
MYWAVAQTESQREHVAAKFLAQENYETYLPRIAVKGARERVVPLFPAYLFVRIVDRWWSIRWTVGILRVLMSDEQPAAISDKTIAAIQKREGENGLVKLPKPPGLKRGQSVRVVSGSFADRVGIYDGTTSGDRVRILLELLGRAVPVLISPAGVRPLDEITGPPPLA